MRSEPVRYETVLERLFAEQRHLARFVPRSYFGDREIRDLVRFLFGRQTERAVEVDGHIAHWIDCGTWLEAQAWDVELRYLTAMRFSCAMDTLNLLLQEDRDGRPMIPEPRSGLTSARLLRWLLIESWNGWRWDTWLKLEALRVDGGDDSFYGLGKSS